MSKNKREFQDNLNRIEKMKKELEKERKKAVIQCNHRSGKGNLKLAPLGGNEFECTICKTRFNAGKVSEENLLAAIDTVHDAIQQIRAFSDKSEDESLVKFFGEIDYNVQSLPELYRRVMAAYSHSGGKKKKHHRDDQRFGSYGSSGLDFIGGSAKQRKWS